MRYPLRFGGGVWFIAAVILITACKIYKTDQLKFGNGDKEKGDSARSLPFLLLSYFWHFFVAIGIDMSAIDIIKVRIPPAPIVRPARAPSSIALLRL